MKNQPQTKSILPLALGTANYPKRLLDLADPPHTIYIAGKVELLNMPMVAIVGSRIASPEGIKNASYFARALSNAGLLVVSGLARGIDGASHLAALAAGHPTIAICGTGLDLTYPPEHDELANEIHKNGLLLSEQALGVGPRAFHFPRRNRLIAALAMGVLVVEAAQRSGSLITARLAMELGREVFAIPSSIHSPLSTGCHYLIGEGAKLVSSPKEVLEELIY
jgi:DNA processing protein